MLRWNKAIWLDVPSHVTYFYQSERFISILHSYAARNIAYDIRDGSYYDFTALILCYAIYSSILIGWNFVVTNQNALNNSIA